MSTNSKHRYASSGGGCTVMPAEPCKKGRDYGVPTVAKLFETETEMEWALNVDSNMKTKNPRDKFTMEVLDHCQIPISEYPDAVEQCVNQNFGESKTISQILYPKYDRIVDAALIYPFEKIFFALENCFRGILEIDQRGYVHTEINCNNIAYDEKRDSTILGYFDNAVLKHNLYNYTNSASFLIDTIYFPPETLVIAPLLYDAQAKYFVNKSLRECSDKMTSSLPDDVKEIVKLYGAVLYKSRDVVKKILDYPPSPIRTSDPSEFETLTLLAQNLVSTRDKLVKIITELRHYFSTGVHDSILSTIAFRNVCADLLACMNRNQPISEKMHDFVEKYDVYSLGITILRLMLISCRYNNLNSEGKVDFYTRILELVQNMIEAAPDRRYTSEKAYYTYLSIKTGSKNSKKSLSRKNESVIRKSKS